MQVSGETIGLWRSLVARVVRDDEAAGSNPVSPTSRSHQNPGASQRAGVLSTPDTFAAFAPTGLPADRQPRGLVRYVALVQVGDERQDHFLDEAVGPLLEALGAFT